MVGREARHEGHALAVCPEGSAGGCLAKDLRCPAIKRTPFSLHIVHRVVLALYPAQGDCIERLFSFTHMRTLVDSPLKLSRPSMPSYGGTHHRGWAAWLLLHSAL